MLIVLEKKNTCLWIIIERALDFPFVSFSQVGR